VTRQFDSSTRMNLHTLALPTFDSSFPGHMQIDDFSLSSNPVFRDWKFSRIPGSRIFESAGKLLKSHSLTTKLATFDCSILFIPLRKPSQTWKATTIIIPVDSLLNVSLSTDCIPF